MTVIEGFDCIHIYNAIRSWKRVRETMPHIFIHEDLTPIRAALLYKARQAKRQHDIVDCWSFDGRIVIKDANNKIRTINECGKSCRERLCVLNIASLLCTTFVLVLIFLYFHHVCTRTRHARTNFTKLTLLLILLTHWRVFLKILKKHEDIPVW